MRTRTISGLLMAPLVIFVFLGGYFLIAGAFVLSILAIREYCAAFGDKRPAAWPLYASLCILYIGFIALQFPFGYPQFDGGLSIFQHFPVMRVQTFFIILCALFISLLLCFISTLSMEKKDIVSGMAGVVGVFYVNFFPFHLVLLGTMFTEPFNLAGAIGLRPVFMAAGLNSFVWLAIITAFVTDIFAYLSGRLFGKHKLIPSVSPNKTVEGAVGGLIGSIVICGLFGCFFLPGGLILSLIIGAFGGVFSQLGDLFASAMKRRIGIKDWGNVIPGHGGVLDRIDSLLFTAPVVFYILAIRAAYISMFMGL